MKGDEISLRYGSSWEGKGHVVKVPDSKLLFSTIIFFIKYLAI